MTEKGKAMKKSYELYVIAAKSKDNFTEKSCPNNSMVSVAHKSVIGEHLSKYKPHWPIVH